MINARGRATGYNQIAPGRDVERLDEERPGTVRRGVIDSALTGGMPVGGASAPFAGARQTIGAQPPSAMDRLNAVETGGITGPAKPDYSQWGQYMSEGMDASKIANGHDSPKYQIARVLSHFDPSKGITPEALEALNALGIGTFTGGRDRLSVGGQLDPRFEGITGADMIRNFTSNGGSTAWQGWGGIGAEGPGVGRGGAVAPNPMINSALLGGAVPPVADQGYATRLREQIMQALSKTPQLQGLIK